MILLQHPNEFKDIWENGRDQAHDERDLIVTQPRGIEIILNFFRSLHNPDHGEGGEDEEEENEEIGQDSKTKHLPTET
jgi:hypothetical protein